jgi:hypothetical protein
MAIGVGSWPVSFITRFVSKQIDAHLKRKAAEVRCVLGCVLIDKACQCTPEAQSSRGAMFMYGTHSDIVWGLLAMAMGEGVLPWTMFTSCHHFEVAPT